MDIVEGELSNSWKGDSASEESQNKRGNKEAIKLYPNPEPCVICRKLKKREGQMIRHHVNGNTHNNRNKNVFWLCSPCHMSLENKIDLNTTKYRKGLLLKLKINVEKYQDKDPEKKKGGKGKR